MSMAHFILELVSIIGPCLGLWKAYADLFKRCNCLVLFVVILVIISIRFAFVYLLQLSFYLKNLYYRGIYSMVPFSGGAYCKVISILLKYGGLRMASSLLQLNSFGQLTGYCICKLTSKYNRRHDLLLFILNLNLITISDGFTAYGYFRLG